MGRDPSPRHPFPAQECEAMTTTSPDWADEKAREVLCHHEHPFAERVAQALRDRDREAYGRGAADENARIFHTNEFGSGSTAIPTSEKQESVE